MSFITEPVTPTEPVAPTVAATPKATTAPGKSAPPMPTVHVIEPGDTLDSIAATYGVDSDALHSWNGGELDRQAAARGHNNSEGGRILFPGSELSLVPTKQGASTPAPAPSNANEIARMHQLYTSGVLSEDEWTTVKAKLLGA